MTTRSLVQLRGLFEDLPGGSKAISPPDIQNNIPPDYAVQLVLTSGLNTISIPSTIGSIQGALVVFDPNSTVAKTVLGSAGDSGIPLDPNGWNVLTFDPTNLPSQIIITAGAADTGKVSSVILF